MTSKPPLPDNAFAPWPRIAVDTSESGPFARILRLGVFAADVWTFGPDGPYRHPQTPAAITRGQLREALLHLLELGLIDIDTERIAAAPGIPCQREEKNRRPSPGTCHTGPAPGT